MRSFEKTSRRNPHMIIPKAATEPQAVISRGEEFLERAHELAHRIEEHVRQVLELPKNVASYPSPDSPNHS